MAIKELFYDQRPEILLDPRASRRIDPRFKFTRNSIGTYIDSDGNITTAPINQPRFDIGSTNLDNTGLLIEKSAINISFDVNSYVSAISPGAANWTIAYNTTEVVAPDGTNTAAKVFCTTETVNTNSFIQSPDFNTTSPGELTLGRQVVQSFFFKPGSSNQVFVDNFASITPRIRTNIDVTTGATTVPNNFKVIPYPNGWYRVYIIGTVTTAGTITWLRFAPQQGTNAFGYFWGPQIEFDTDAPSSYIFTTTSSATRDADLLSVTTNLPTTGSLYVDSKASSTAAGSTLISIKNASNQKLNLAVEERSELYNSAALVYSVQGTIKPTLPFPVPTSSREQNIITWGTNNYQYTSSSARFAQSLSGSIPANLSQLSIGHDSVDPTQGFQGYINAVYLYSGEITPTVAEALVRGELDPINADTFVPTGPAGALSLIINTQGLGNTGDTVFELPAASVADNNDIVITWGDQTESGLENSAAEVGAPGLTKNYSAAGIYSVFVEGRLENLQFNNIASAPDLVQIVRWGTSANGNDVFLSPSTLNSAFAGCAQLDFSSVARTTNLPDTSGVSDWNFAFDGCQSITGAFPQFNFSGATSLFAAFRNCSSITSFTPAGNQTQNVTTFANAWSGCSSLTSFPLINTSSATTLQTAWFGCSGLTGPTAFPAIITSSVQNFQGAWFNCSGLTAFPNIVTSSGTNFANAWQNCSGLSTFPLLDTSSGTNFLNAWYGCTGLTGATAFPAINLSSASSVAAAWFGCSGLTAFPTVDLSSCINFNSTWFNCSGLTAFPSGIDVSAGTSFDSTWRGCSSLSLFPNLTTSAAQNVARAWLGCSGLTAFPALDFSAVVGLASDSAATFTGFRDTWSFCTSLANFPANVFDSTASTRYLGAFFNCALTVQSVENILVSIEVAGTSDGVLSLEGGTNANRATWTVTADNAYNALIGRGWTITFNTP